MRIGIDGSRAFLKQRTGIEEYSYQVIKNLRGKFKQHQVALYLRPGQTVDLALPENWRIKQINPPFFWTQIGLSYELLLHPVDALFIPGHTAPLIHPKNTVVTVHGLEYELMPEAYSAWERLYMRFSIKNSCRWARKIVSVSRNTRQDLMTLYDISEEKINIVYEGYEKKAQEEVVVDEKVEHEPYFLFIGRLERRKNIEGIVESFNLFKEKYQTEHKLVLGGKFGYGGEDIQVCIDRSKFKQDICLLGFVDEETKWRLFRRATVFLFPTLYEGFGLPVLEAQSRGIPVITSNVSSLPEITNGSAVLVDPKEPEMICEALRSLTEPGGTKLCAELVKKGHENVKRFSWENCAGVIARILTEN